MSSAPWNPRYNGQQLQSWLQTCIYQHPECSRFQSQATDSSERPSRMLQISRDQLKLQCNTLELQASSYLTLSHMWGLEPTDQFILTEARLGSYQEGILLETLPAIFREAIHLTRLLGHEYLWVDSLCIVQDSPTDWEVEASKMASTYGNALCNLACLFPPDRFHPDRRRDPRAYVPCIVRPATTEVKGVYAISLDVYWQPEANEQPRRSDKSELWPLFSRAWYVFSFTVHIQKAN
jgi:hypothetical protein